MSPTQKERPVPLSNGPAVPHLILNTTALTFLPAPEFIQISQLHLSARTKGHLPHPFFTTKSASHCCSLFTVPKCNHYLALQGMQYPPLLGWEYMCLLNCSLSHLSSVRYYVFSLLVRFKVQDPSLINRVNRRWSDHQLRPPLKNNWKPQGLSQKLEQRTH